jgi:Mg-chelatase subunit ChlD
MSQSTPAPKSTHIVVLLDRSGSMESIAGDVIGGYNGFINQQRQNGADAIVTLVQFDSQDSHEVVYEGIRLDEVPALTAQTFVPRGSTPLFDATGQLVAKIRQQQAVDSRATHLQPDVVFVTITDGEENHSTEYNLTHVRELIANCEAQGWTFVYLSAGIDAFGDADQIGVKSGRTRAFRASKAGTDAMFDALSTNMSFLRDKKRRGMDTSNDNFFDDDKVNQILGDD